MHFSSTYTVGFAGAVCVVCSVFVAGSAVALKERQELNAVVDRQTQVLEVAGLREAGEQLSPTEVRERFRRNLVARVVELESGDYLPDVDPEGVDMDAAMKDPELSEAAPDNPAKVLRVPKRGLVYELRGEGGRLQAVILPVQGKGLWSTLKGYIALKPDTTTVAGLTFYSHAETPGLGGEVDNPKWKAEWPGREVFDEEWKPEIEVIKGQAGPPEQDPHRVDGLSGATITSRGVTHLIRFWVGEAGFGPYLAKVRAGSQPAADGD